MDASIIGWLVPMATINVYFATPENISTAIDTAVNDGCSVISCCFGLHDESLFQDIYNSIVAGANKNVTFCFASGDSGAGSGPDFNGYAGFPSSHPNVLAAGGTFIPTGPLPASYTCNPMQENVEQVWWNFPPGPTPSGRTWWSSGGGVSKLYSVPDCQAVINPTSYPVNGYT